MSITPCIRSAFCIVLIRVHVPRFFVCVVLSILMIHLVLCPMVFNVVVISLQFFAKSCQRRDRFIARNVRCQESWFRVMDIWIYIFYSVIKF